LASRRRYAISKGNMIQCPNNDGWDSIKPFSKWFALNCGAILPFPIRDGSGSWIRSRSIRPAPLLRIRILKIRTRWIFRGFGSYCGSDLDLDLLWDPDPTLDLYANLFISFFFDRALLFYLGFFGLLRFETFEPLRRLLSLSFYLSQNSQPVNHSAHSSHLLSPLHGSTGRRHTPSWPALQLYHILSLWYYGLCNLFSACRLRFGNWYGMYEY